MKQIVNFIIVLLIFMAAFVACSKKDQSTQAVTSNFYHGNILGSPSTIIGPGNAILLRDNGTMRDYYNDTYSLGTSMTASDTASAKWKLDGTYTTIYLHDTTVVTATWVQPNSSPILTYTLVGAIVGHNMTGTYSSAGTGIGSSTQFKFTNNP